MFCWLIFISWFILLARIFDEKNIYGEVFSLLTSAVCSSPLTAHVRVGLYIHLGPHCACQGRPIHLGPHCACQGRPIHLGPHCACLNVCILIMRTQRQERLTSFFAWNISSYTGGMSPLAYKQYAGVVVFPDDLIHLTLLSKLFHWMNIECPDQPVIDISYSPLLVFIQLQESCHTTVEVCVFTNEGLKYIIGLQCSKPYNLGRIYLDIFTCIIYTRYILQTRRRNYSDSLTHTPPPLPRLV